MGRYSKETYVITKPWILFDFSSNFEGYLIRDKTMALYALGDLHLSFQADKPMDVFGKEWRNHERRIEKNCNKLIGDDDTLVLVGDHS